MSRFCETPTNIKLHFRELYCSCFNLLIVLCFSDCLKLSYLRFPVIISFLWRLLPIYKYKFGHLLVIRKGQGSFQVLVQKVKAVVWPRRYFLWSFISPAFKLDLLRVKHPKIAISFGEVFQSNLNKTLVINIRYFLVPTTITTLISVKDEKRCF